jgi:hypothetical protein
MRSRQVGILATTTLASGLLLGTVFSNPANACIQAKVNGAVQWLANSFPTKNIAAKIGLGLLVTGTVGTIAYSISRRQTAPSNPKLQSIKTTL